MKKISFVVVMVIMLLGIVSLTYADVNDQVRAFRDGLFLERAQLRADRAAIDKEYEQLTALDNTWKDAAKNYKNQVDIHNEAVRAFSTEASQYDSQVATHNANRCTGNCDSYNAEADRFDVWKGRLDTERTRINNKASDLDWSKRQLENQKLSINKQWDDYNVKVDKWKAKRDELMPKIVEYLKLTKDCINIIKSGKSDEAISLGCGVFFDGSDNTLPTLESLGVTPGTKGWSGLKMIPNK